MNDFVCYWKSNMDKTYDIYGCIFRMFVWMELIFYF